MSLIPPLNNRGGIFNLSAFVGGQDSFFIAELSAIFQPRVGMAF